MSVARLAIAVQAMQADAGLRDLVLGRVDAFFAAHPEMDRTRWAETCAAVVAFEQVTAEQQTAEERRVA
jgi:hypothetical protein